MNQDEILTQLCALLGVETNDEIIGAVELLQTQVADAAEAEANREMDDFVDENEEEIEDLEAFKEAFKKDPENAKALFTATRRKKVAPKFAPRRIDASTVRTRPAIGGADTQDAAAVATRRAVQSEVRRLNSIGIYGTAALQRAELSHGITH